MFADNWKISLRQVRRLLILDIFGLSSLQLPGLLSSMTGADGLFGLLLGMAGGGLMLWLIQKNIQNIEGSYYQYMKDALGQLTGDIFMMFYYLYFITVSGYVLYQAAVLALTWLLPEGSYVWVSILLLFLAGYGTIRGIEGRARVYEIIFWFLGIPLLVMLFLSLGEVHADYWTPIFYSSGLDILKGGVDYWIFLLPLTAILFLKPFCKKSEKIASCGRAALLSVTILNAAIYLILLGVFGTNAMGVLKRPIITLMSMVNLPGGFFTRQDVIMVSVWFFALFALMHTGIFQSALILKELFHESGNRCSVCISLALAFVAGMGFFANSFLAEVYGIYQKWIVLPGMAVILLAVPFAYRIRVRAKREKGGEEQ